MKIRVYYKTVREVEIEVDNKYQKLVDSKEFSSGELTAEEWEEIGDLHDNLESDIREIEIEDDVEFICAETLSGKMLHEWW